MKNNNTSRRLPSQVVMGLLVIAMGLLFLLDNLGIIDFHHAIAFWPIVFIVAGLVKMSDTGSPNNYLVGGILVVIGAVMMSNRLGLFYLTWHTLWPLLLIGVGVLVLYRAIDASRQRQGVDLRKPAAPPGADWQQGDPRAFASKSGADDVVDITAILGGFERSITSPAFRGGAVSAILGGCELDMRGASIQGEAVLNVFAFMGGITIKCPPDWTVVLHGSPIIGGFEEKTAHPLNDNKRLIVTGYVILGGLEVRN
jgi:predicted membrane protein